MKYTVVWRETALRQLVDIWFGADDRAGVTRTIDAIDAELLHDPDLKGDDYFGDRYVTFPLLWALFRVEPADVTVHVLQVGRPGVDLPHENSP